MDRKIKEIYYWYLDDKLHKTDGPAVKWKNYEAWYLLDIHLKEYEFNSWILRLQNIVRLKK